jgi:hypothetical protein
LALSSMKWQGLMIDTMVMIITMTSNTGILSDCR